MDHLYKHFFFAEPWLAAASFVAPVCVFQRARVRSYSLVVIRRADSTCSAHPRKRSCCHSLLFVRLHH